ncbi:probable xyloglucan endotransglucosylase/hydrolase protein 26, partial [Tanacetum coccineum]
ALRSSMVNANFPKSMYFNWGAQHSSILGKGGDLRLVLDQILSLWNADNWDTRGGLVNIDWTAAPFVAYYRRFRATACKWNGPVSIRQCGIPSKGNWWTSNVYKQLTMSQQGQLKWVRDNHMIYNYRTDFNRFKGTDGT